MSSIDHFMACRHFASVHGLSRSYRLSMCGLVTTLMGDHHEEPMCYTKLVLVNYWVATVPLGE